MYWYSNWHSVGKVGVSMKLNNIVIIQDRKQNNSSEFFIDVEITEDEFYVPIAREDVVIGYLQFKRDFQKTFGLSGLLTNCCQNPYPIVSMSGVLYSRQAALEANEALTSYVRAVDQIR